MRSCRDDQLDTDVFGTELTSLTEVALVELFVSCKTDIVVSEQC